MTAESQDNPSTPGESLDNPPSLGAKALEEEDDPLEYIRPPLEENH